LEVVKDFMPDLIFMDHHMPEMDGREATRLLKSNDATRHIPVVYFSSAEQIEQLAREAGADGFLAKPFKIEQLIAKINHY
jgi:two-component system cell cycle response regulator DivK